MNLALGLSLLRILCILAKEYSTHCNILGTIRIPLMAWSRNEFEYVEEKESRSGSGGKVDRDQEGKQDQIFGK